MKFIIKFNIINICIKIALFCGQYLTIEAVKITYKIRFKKMQKFKIMQYYVIQVLKMEQLERSYLNEERDQVIRRVSSL